MRHYFLFSLIFVFSTGMLFAQNNSLSDSTISKAQYEALLQRITQLEQSQKMQNSSDTTADDVLQTGSRLQIGGYGEAVMHRYFYSDNFNRYLYPDQFKKSKSRGLFDLPHVVFTVGYDFGKGWKVYTEVEYEHGGAGTAIEIESEEFGEYESEIEKGGEVNLEQFWIEKTWNEALHLRAGHIIVPFGLTNQYHLPIEFFSVLRQEEESSILPCTWHETGISLWGKKNNWRYEFQFLTGLDADRFNDASWIKGGAGSPYEFKLATAYAGAFRVDNYSVKGLRIGVSGYYGHSAANSLKADRYKGLLGAVILGAIDLTYNDHNVIFTANFDYGHLTDSKAISQINKNLPRNSPSPRTNVASDALCYAASLGYDFFSLNDKLATQKTKFFLFAHYGYVSSMFKTAEGILADARYTKHLLSGGINYYPIKEVAIKLEFLARFFPKAVYNPEYTLSLGITYAGFFTKNFAKKNHK